MIQVGSKIKGLVDGKKGTVVEIEQGSNNRLYAKIEWRVGKKVSYSQVTLGYLGHLKEKGEIEILSQD